VRDTAPYRYRIRRADTGEERWILAHGEATFEVVDGIEKATRYTGTVQDITEQKRAQDALIESEARLRLAVDAGDMAVWEVELDTDKLIHSPQLNVLFGFPADAHPSVEELRSRYAPGERDRLARERQALLAGRDQPLQTEFRVIWPDGSEHWLLLRAAIVPNEGRTGKRAIGVIMETTERKLAEERVRTVAAELQHRMKNLLTIVQTIATQTLRDLNAHPAVESFLGRLQALAAATDIFTLSNWSTVEVGSVISEITAPFRNEATENIVVRGERVRVPSNVAIALGLAAHELCTNAAKYGSLSAPGGRVEVEWSRNDGGLVLEWREVGGPAVRAPQHKGFGTRLLERGIFAESEGRIRLDYAPEGLVAHIEAKL
jgi:PAS domain S-box-containing protein